MARDDLLEGFFCLQSRVFLPSNLQESIQLDGKLTMYMLHGYLSEGGICLAWCSRRHRRVICSGNVLSLLMFGSVDGQVFSIHPHYSDPFNGRLLKFIQLLTSHVGLERQIHVIPHACTPIFSTYDYRHQVIYLWTKFAACWRWVMQHHQRL